MEYNRYKEVRVSCVMDILNVVSQYPDLRFFRGQSDVKWRLVPKISRMFTRSRIPDTWDRVEAFIMGEFKQYAVPHIKREPKNDFEWMVLGQHYGLPTRLLDWTSNPLKGAFFAVNELAGKRNGALFAFAPTSWLPDLDDNESIEVFKDLMPIFPKMIDNRIIAQEACFTAFQRPPDYKPFKPLDNRKAYHGAYFILVKMIIPADKKPVLLRELDRLGVNNRSLFPDMSGLANHIAWKRLPENDY